LTTRFFSTICSTEMSQGVVTLLRPPAWTLDHVFRGLSLVVVVDGVQDPGNGGAIVRAAEAFGATGVVFLKGSANPYNPKALRASAGSVFRIPLVAAADDRLLLGRRGEETRAVVCGDAARRIDD
jgi:TrmH family RNA methyltransferase